MRDAVLRYILEYRTHHNKIREIIKFLVFAMVSTFITVFRLTFGCVNAVYFVHAIVIFIDLLIGNFFCRSLLFNCTLNILSLTLSIVYKCYPELVLELLETTLMAVIASVYGLYIKYKHRRSIETFSTNADDYYQLHIYLQKLFGKTFFEFIIEEFIDGPSGIMYTSFTGLIIIEIVGLVLGSDNKSYVYCVLEDNFMRQCRP